MKIIFDFHDQTFALCDDQRGFIRRENGTKIKIVSANFGLTDDQVCPGGNTSTRTCRSKSSETRVRWNCNEYSSCDLQALNQLFGNPCANFLKYLEVKYYCGKIKKKIWGILMYVLYVCIGLILNYRNAYNTHIGMLTAPSAGLYIFHLEFCWS